MPITVGPDLLPGNRWRRLTCVGTKCSYMSCVWVSLAWFKLDSNRLLLAANETA
jgi:hypothetical protein